MGHKGQQALATRLRPIFVKHCIERAILFGSLARGDVSRYSDVDLILVQRTNKRFLDRYDGILAEVSRAIPDRDVDMLIYTPEELETMKNRALISTALREGIVLYELGQE